MLQSFTQWISENSSYSSSDQLSDLERLHDIGMIDSKDLIREKIKIQVSLGKLTKLTKSEISLLDSELEEEIEEWVKNEALDVLYVFDSPEEEDALDDCLMESFDTELAWQVYLNGTIDVSMFFPNLGPKQRLIWLPPGGTTQRRDILDYFKEPIMRQLNPNEILGRIELPKYVTKSIQELVNGLTNNNN